MRVDCHKAAWGVDSMMQAMIQTSRECKGHQCTAWLLSRSSMMACSFLFHPQLASQDQASDDACLNFCDYGAWGHHLSHHQLHAHAGCSQMNGSCSEGVLFKWMVGGGGGAFASHQPCFVTAYTRSWSAHDQAMTNIL